MDCIKKEFVRTDADGHKWWRVVLTATEAPDSLQLTGADVDGMDDNIRFEAGSVLLTPDGNYIAFEDGDFSGEGGATELRVNEDGGVLDKTWQEIKDAFDAGADVIIDTSDLQSFPITDVYEDDGSYWVKAEIESDEWYYVAETPEGYPVQD